MRIDHPRTNAAAGLHDRLLVASIRAAAPNGMTAEISDGYLQLIAPPASKPIKHQSGARGTAESFQPRTTAHTRAAWKKQSGPST